MNNTIIIQLLGRLGNCMFLFGLGLSLEKLYPDKKVLFYYSKNHPPDTKEVCDNLIDLFKNYFKLEFIDDPLPESEILQSDEFVNLQDIPIPKDKNILLRSFFQSDKFLNKEICQKRFSCPDYLKNQINNIYGEISDHVGIHVRRGDYLGSGYFLTLGSDWYLKCMDLFPEDQKFIIVSDDMDWCKDNLTKKNTRFADIDVENKNLVDLYIQSMCRDNIISASSFSWWGSYLNTNQYKKVYAPKNWPAAGVDSERYYTKDMIKIS